MKAGMTLAELAAEIERQAAMKADYVADTRRMVMYAGDGDGGPRVGLFLDGANGEEPLDLDIADHAHGQIGERVGIPTRYYERMRGEAPELLTRNVNHWFRERPEKRMVRTLDGKARAFLSNRYRRLDNDRLAEALLPSIATLGDGARVESCALTDSRLYIKVVVPAVTAEIRLGEIVHSGVVISNSEVGAGAFSVETLLFKLACLNGAIVGTQLRKTHVGREVEEEAYALYKDETLAADDRAFFLKARDLVEAACSEAAFQAIVAQVRERAEMPVGGDPPGVVERLATAHGFTQDESASVLRHLIEGGDLTAWGYVNAVTRAAQDVDGYDRATELERAGGRLIAAPAEFWTAAAA